MEGYVFSGGGVGGGVVNFTQFYINVLLNKSNVAKLVGAS